MCGCEHHHDSNAPCTCSCPEHDAIRREMEQRLRIHPDYVQVEHVAEFQGLTLWLGDGTALCVADHWEGPVNPILPIQRAALIARLRTVAEILERAR